MIHAKVVNFSDSTKGYKKYSKRKRQQQDIESLPSVSSLVKSSKSKKLPPIHEQKKAALPIVNEEKRASTDLLEREKGIIAQAVKETKQTKTGIESSKEENSTESESNLTQVKMSAPFDTKLEHLLDIYLCVKSGKHEIWQTFVENDILTYDEFLDTHTLESLKKLKQKKGNSSVTEFTDGKLILVNNALLYYSFLCQDGEVAEANDPTLWDKDKFRKWKTDGFSLSTKALNSKQTGNTTNAANANLNTTNTVAPGSKSKLEEDTWLSWRRSRQDEIKYPFLENNRAYTDWLPKFRRKIASEEKSRMINPAFHKN